MGDVEVEGMPVRRRIFWRVLLTLLATVVPASLVVTWLLCLAISLSAGGILVLLCGVGVSIIVASILAAILAASQTTSVVADLGRVLQRVSDGDYSAQLPLEQRWLLEPLGKSADQMQESLSRRFELLQASRDQLRTVLNSMLEGVIAVDESHRVILVNHSACRMFRFQEQAAIGRPVYELIRNPLLLDWVNIALVQSEPVGGDIELTSPVSRALSVRAAGLPAGSTRGAVVVISDVSELRRLEQVRQQFVANASHELKTPLASISACAETLLDGATEDPVMCQQFLTTIQEQADRLTHLVLDLLAITRIESDGLPRQLRPVSLEDVLNVCWKRHQQHAERKQMTLVREQPSEPLILLADEEGLEQILDNLLDNAMKYTDEGGRITVRWWGEDNQCILEIEDTGIGIPQNQLARIFERFHRVDRARSRELGGTGLGLSIVKHLTQALGGSISVSSRLGKGSTFTIRLPLSSQRPAAPQSVSPPEAGDIASVPFAANQGSTG